MNWFETFVVWLLLHLVFFVANIEHYNWLQ
jgi:hypothetical protein